ncbi:6-bladed beta-propeller [Marinobacter sp. SS21]|uniref:6-bladed beta-propeller n=1 Tax=Marinobacter sp. SS21 TaxID=2979460 RepID=UPI002330EAB4|nr:6-bladed beta-propeller [Marinobacter sp. SS21]MDC0662343.1 6-bladed beta-propeller [Marinobacter sp. SS21]
MVRFGPWLGYGTLAILALLVVLAWAGGALNWHREPSYVLARHWGEQGHGRGQFNNPTGIAVTADEVFVADAGNSRIQVFDKLGRYKRGFGSTVLGRPMNLAIAGDRLYVPDYFKDVIHVFTLDGEYRRAIEADDGLTSPGGVAVRPDGTLLIADTYGQRVVHLDPAGKRLESWNGRGIGPGAFNYPTDVAVALDGGFYVADGYNDRVLQFSRDGEFVHKWGGPFAMNIHGPFKGWFSVVTSVAVGPDGMVYVADFYNDRIQKFTPWGRFLTAFGTLSQGPAQSHVSVAVDADQTLWTVNSDASRVERWRP